MYDIWYCLNASILTYILEKCDAQYMYVTILPACYRKRLMFCLKGLEKNGKKIFLYTIYSINIIKVCTRLHKVYFIIAIVAHVSDVAHESLVK